MRVTVYDGKYHAVDSSEMAFKIAGQLGMKAALAKAHPVLLEPVMTVVWDGVEGQRRRRDGRPLGTPRPSAGHGGRRQALEMRLGEVPCGDAELRTPTCAP